MIERDKRYQFHIYVTSLFSYAKNEELNDSLK